MDSSHVALVQMHLAREGFARYTIERNTTIGLSIQNLSKVMRLVGANDSITLRIPNCDENGPTTLSIICESNR